MNIVKIIQRFILVIKPFSTNVPFTDKPGSWFLLTKCLKKLHSSTGVFQTFSTKNQLSGFYVSRTLVENGLTNPHSNSGRGISWKGLV